MNMDTKILSPILLVDDEEDIRDVLEMALVDAGHKVLLAENGRQALEIFDDKLPEIVITDIKMPTMDGIELLQKIKRKAPETEVIMITGHGDMDLAIRSLKHEASDFITKPINVDALEIALNRVMERILIREKLYAYTTNLERLLKEKSELQDHLSSLGLMIGSISHGIKGLLTGLDGGMYILESGLARKDEAKINEGYETVKVMVTRIRKMVMDILFYAKKRDLQWEEIDVTSFSNEAARMMAAKVIELPVTFICDIKQNLGECRIDPGYVHAALMNIFENAIDACLRGTSCQLHEIHFSVQLDNGWIKFSVSDTGIGMDEETQTKLFTVFFSSKGRKGTGLGLFIANRIVEQHGGRIEVRSTPKRGSRFTILLPQKAA
ncbi:MAG: response regulator [Desulfobacteraceae bacterium]|jgi:signal transduction histidine kinase